MRRLTLIALLLIAGRAAAGEQVISVQHDSVRGVTCWILNNTGISCLPDSSFTRQGGTTHSAEENRAFQASSSPQNGNLGTTPPPGLCHVSIAQERVRL